MFKGVQIEILKKNPGIYFYSGLRKKIQGGGGANRNPIKSRYILL